MGDQQLKIILVHGACHGAWSWFKVAAALRSEGYSVITLDLAASGINKKRLIEDVFTFAEYSEPLMQILAKLPEGEKTILVGHSLGGLNLALAMNTFPEKIAVAVFVTAFLPDTISPPSYVLDKLGEYIPTTAWMDTEFKEVRVPGREQSLLTMLFGPQFMEKYLYQLCVHEHVEHSPETYKDVEFKEVIIPGSNNTLMITCLEPKFLATSLYQNCTFEDLTLASMMMRPTSLFHEELSKKLAFSKEGYGSVDKIYIICEEDAAIGSDFERWMIQNNPVKEVMEIKGADHMAMLSKPKELCQCITSIVNKYVN